MATRSLISGPNSGGLTEFSDHFCRTIIVYCPYLMSDISSTKGGRILFILGLTLLLFAKPLLCLAHTPYVWYNLCHVCRGGGGEEGVLK